MWSVPEGEGPPDDCLAYMQNLRAISNRFGGKHASARADAFLRQPAVDLSAFPDPEPDGPEDVEWFQIREGWYAGMTCCAAVAALACKDFPLAADGTRAVMKKAEHASSYMLMLRDLAEAPIPTGGPALAVVPLWRRVGKAEADGGLTEAAATALSAVWPDRHSDTAPLTRPPSGLAEWRPDRPGSRSSDLDALFTSRVNPKGGGAAPKAPGVPTTPAAPKSSKKKKRTEDGVDAAMDAKRAHGPPSAAYLEQEEEQDEDSEEEPEADGASSRAPSRKPAAAPCPPVPSSPALVLPLQWDIGDDTPIDLPNYGKAFQRTTKRNLARLHVLEKEAFLHHISSDPLRAVAERLFTAPFTFEPKYLHRLSMLRAQFPLNSIAGEKAAGRGGSSAEITTLVQRFIRTAHNPTKQIDIGSNYSIDQVKQAQPDERRKAYYMATGRTLLQSGLQGRVDMCQTWDTILNELLLAARSAQQECSWFTDHLVALQMEQVLCIPDAAHFSCELLLGLLDDSCQEPGVACRPEDRDLEEFLEEGWGCRTPKEAATKYQSLIVAVNMVANMEDLVEMEVVYCRHLRAWLDMLQNSMNESLRRLYAKVRYSAEKRYSRANLPTGPDGAPLMTLLEFRGFEKMLYQNTPLMEKGWEAEYGEIVTQLKQKVQDDPGTLPTGRNPLPGAGRGQPLTGNRTPGQRPPGQRQPGVNPVVNSAVDSDDPPPRGARPSGGRGGQGGGSGGPPGGGLGGGGGAAGPAVAKTVDFNIPHVKKFIEDFPQNEYSTRRESVEQSVLSHSEKINIDRALLMTPTDPDAMEKRRCLSLVWPARQVIKCTDGTWPEGTWYVPPSAPGKNDSVYYGVPRNDLNCYSADGTPTDKCCLHCAFGIKKANLDTNKPGYWVWGSRDAGHPLETCLHAKLSAHWYNLAGEVVLRPDEVKRRREERAQTQPGGGYNPTRTDGRFDGRGGGGRPGQRGGYPGGGKGKGR